MIDVDKYKALLQQNEQAEKSSDSDAARKILEEMVELAVMNLTDTKVPENTYFDKVEIGCNRITDCLSLIGVARNGRRLIVEFSLDYTKAYVGNRRIEVDLSPEESELVASLKTKATNKMRHALRELIDNFNVFSYACNTFIGTTRYGTKEQLMQEFKEILTKNIREAIIDNIRDEDDIHARLFEYVPNLYDEELTSGDIIEVLESHGYPSYDVHVTK